MASVRPLRGIRFDPSADLGRRLAPPYDVIDDAAREELHARDPHNVVRLDDGRVQAGDVAGIDDRYTRAAAHLDDWLARGILRQDERPAVYVHDHTYPALDGRRRLTRRGLFARVRALPWDRSDVLPHEHTLRGPKEDRLRLMRATHAQTSAVFLLWDQAAGIDGALSAATPGPPGVEATTSGEVGPETHSLWVVDDPDLVAAITSSLTRSRLYMADGHHRFETAAAYAAERRRAEPDAGDDADHQWTLAYLCAADDPGMELLATHRLVRPGSRVPAGIAGLLPRLEGGFTAEPRAGLAEAMSDAAALLQSHDEQAVAVAGSDGTVLLHRPRAASSSARARLDVTAVETEILMAGCGLDAERIGGGALGYTRTVTDAEDAVRTGEAALAVCLNPCTTREMMAVSDAAEQMPQKSTYFYPKVPTGLVLSPL